MTMDPQVQFWSDAWSRHLETYLQAPPRAGYWLERMFRTPQRCLELAGGSCRDTRYLYSKGWDATGSDFDEKTLSYLRDRFAGLGQPLLKLNAFETDLADRAFQLTFHNGFWILFRDDQRIHALVKEQARITSETMVILVHNARNRPLLAQFAEKARHDPLYDVRFFDPAEIVRIVTHSGVSFRELKAYRFGGRADVLFRSHIRRCPNPLRALAARLVPRLYRLQSWESTERIALVVSL